MVIKQAELEAVCGITSKLPENAYPEVAFAGKSNVGKSSLINSLVNRKALARTSSQPGKTQTINFYRINQAEYLVDLPGYGYAKVPQSEKEKWGKTLDAFFKNKQKISHVLMLADSRHDPTADDMQMMEFLHYHIIPFTVVLTKTDKLSKMKLKEHVRAIAADLCLGVGNLIPVSAETGFGKDAVLEKIGEIVAAEKRKRQPEEDGERDEKETCGEDAQRSER